MNYPVGAIKPAEEYSLFVGDLAVEVTEDLLVSTFKIHYKSVKGVRIIMDPVTKRSKGYGFVKFGDENEQMRALTEMNNMEICGQRIRISLGQQNKGGGGGVGMSASNSATPSGQQNSNAVSEDPLKIAAIEEQNSRFVKENMRLYEAGFESFLESSPWAKMY